VTIRPIPVKPLPGQESVWDYPRPSWLETFVGTITVELGAKTVASTTRAWRVLQTSTPAAPVAGGPECPPDTLAGLTQRQSRVQRCGAHRAIDVRLVKEQP